jgi:hypothetical protein
MRRRPDEAIGVVQRDRQNQGEAEILRDHALTLGGAPAPGFFLGLSGAVGKPIQTGGFSV